MLKAQIEYDRQNTSKLISAQVQNTVSKIIRPRRFVWEHTGAPEAPLPCRSRDGRHQ